MHVNLTGYEVGALLYCPANMHATIVDDLKGGQIPRPFSLAFCLEDTIAEAAVPAAEAELKHTLDQLAEAARRQPFYMPLLFIRVRSPQQLLQLAGDFRGLRPLLTGFILPKFFIENCGDYIRTIQHIQEHICPDYYYMPIFEAASMIPLERRHRDLAEVCRQLEAVRPQILNIRVGGNDLCHAFGLRRHAGDTIYDILPVAGLLSDIVTTFSPHYVVSGPVWEYYAGEGWETGLQRELELDMLCGFIGKTVIHPNQIPAVNRALQIDPADYQDACRILDWDPAASQLVAAGAAADRMNEYNTHSRWAGRILQLARIYGVRGQI